MIPDLSRSKVGVVIVTHNSERFLDRAIDCLLRQTLLLAI